jgi:hypothetical protein
MILVITADGTMQYANPAVRRVLGYGWRSGDALDVLSLIHPEDRERCRETIRRAIERPNSQDASDRRMARAIEHPESREGAEYRMRHANGSYRLLEAIGTNLLDDPAVAGFVITLRDITEERAASERVRQNGDRQAALADLGRWALVNLEYARPRLRCGEGPCRPVGCRFRARLRRPAGC